MAVKRSMQGQGADLLCTMQWHLLLLLIVYGNGLQQLLALFEKDRIVHRKYNPSYSKVFGSTELGSLPVEY